MRLSQIIREDEYDGLDFDNQFVSDLDFDAMTTPMDYRGYNITYWPKPIPSRAHDYDFVHQDYDGPGDNRVGSCGSIRDCILEIEQIEMELGYDN
jgi:hypothetical protein